MNRQRVKKILLYIVIISGLFCLQIIPANGDDAGLIFRQQLQQINRFNQAQEPDRQTNLQNAIEAFITASCKAKNAEELTDESAEAMTAIFKFAFSEEEGSAAVLRAMELSGRMHFKIHKRKSEPGAFAGHVKEAIVINKERAKYYAMRSNGVTSKLSTEFTRLEYALLPVATIFDRWARSLQQKGLAVMQNDFVSMNDIPDADTCPANMGLLNANGIKAFKNILKDFRRQAYRAAAKKDFISVQIHAISALHALKALQQKHHCNLTLSIHLVESIGLAAQNADKLMQQHKNSHQIACFYRALTLSQIFGSRLFADIDLKAQPFHQAGIGIIVNDLPRIPFPAKQ